MALELKRSISSIYSIEDYLPREDFQEEEDSIDVIDCIIKQIKKRKVKKRTSLSKRPTGRLSLTRNNASLLDNRFPCEYNQIDSQIVH